jgi:hypothetical protein
VAYRGQAGVVLTRLRELDLWGALVIILFTVVLSSFVIVDRSSFSFSLGSDLFTHWAAWIGGFWIAVVAPIYIVLKHYRPSRIKAWIRLHMFGNLFAFMLISVHFWYWVTFVSFMGTGFALFAATFTIVVAGFLYRFNIVQGATKAIRFLHISMTTAFYLILTIHILSHMIRL